MAHVVEHVALSNRRMAKTLSKRLLDSPLGERVTDVVDAEIPFLFYRVEDAPELAPPSGTWIERDAALQTLETSAQTILIWASDTLASLRDVALAHPSFGLLDGIQWLLFAAAHMERHRAQLIALRRHPDWPS